MCGDATASTIAQDKIPDLDKKVQDAGIDVIAARTSQRELSTLYGEVLANFISASWEAPGPRVLRHFSRTRKSLGDSDARIPQNFLATPAHGLGWPS